MIFLVVLRVLDGARGRINRSIMLEPYSQYFSKLYNLKYIQNM